MSDPKIAFWGISVRTHFERFRQLYGSKMDLFASSVSNTDRTSLATRVQVARWVTIDRQHEGYPAPAGSGCTCVAARKRAKLRLVATSVRTIGYNLASDGIAIGHLTFCQISKYSSALGSNMHAQTG